MVKWNSNKTKMSIVELGLLILYFVYSTLGINPQYHNRINNL